MLPKISGGFLNLTQKCNLKCKYCFVTQQPKEMDYKTAKDAVDFYAKNALDNLDIPDITFFGGEPLLKFEDIIKPLVEYIRKRYGDFKVSVTTNGTLLDEDKLKFLKANAVDLLLSIDGDEETQDHNRPFHNGKGSFGKIDVDLILRYYPQVTMRATLDPDTVDKLYENYLWGEKKGFKNEALIINPFAAWQEEHYEILESEIRKVTEHIKEARKEGKPYMRFEELHKMKTEYELLQKIEGSYYRDSNKDLPACGRCGLGATRYGSIGSTGNIYSCQEMTENEECSDFIIGNIYEDFSDDKRLELANSFNTKNVKSEKKDRCKDCLLDKICDGGCSINNYFKNKKLDIASEPWCRYKEILIQEYENLEVCD